MGELSPGLLAAIGGLLGGIVLGFAARWGRFCTLGAIEDHVLGGTSTRLRMWGLAIAVAIAATHLLQLSGFVSLSESFYLARPTTFAATLLGSLVFGFGMAMVGTCGYGTLARIGGGDLKSIVTFLIMGITAYATMRGLGAYLRLPLETTADRLPSEAGFAGVIADPLNISSNLVALILASLIALFCLNKALRNRPRFILAAALVGLTIASGWFVTGYVAQDPFEPYPLESYTFSAPLGEALVYVMTMTGSSLKFGIGAVLGVVIGAFLTSLVQNHFRWEVCDDAREMRRQMFGGLLMGFGSVTAMGCTIGQGVSAASVLAFTAPVALIGIYAGAWLGLHWLVQGVTLTELAARMGLKSIAGDRDA